MPEEEEVQEQQGVQVSAAQLQTTLNATIQRLGQQAVRYEAEIANLTAQLVVANDANIQLANYLKEHQTSEESKEVEALKGKK